MREHQYYVYIMASNSRVLYTGFTNDLGRRVFEHKSSLIKGFTQRYKVHKLVYYETFCYVYDAIDREKQIKNWSRQKKNFLIESMNPFWEDLDSDIHF